MPDFSCKLDPAAAFNINLFKYASYHSNTQSIKVLIDLTKKTNNFENLTPD